MYRNETGENTMKTRLLTLVLVSLALFPASLTAAHAASNHAPSYLYTIGVPPLPPIFQGPATAVASDGSKIAMTGIGNFTVEGTARSISGGGNYTLTDAAGNMSSGTWTATHLEGFVSYGTDLSVISQFNLPAGSQGGELYTQIMLSGL